MTAQAVAVTPAATVVKMSQQPASTAEREEKQSKTMSLGMTLAGHNDMSVNQADECNMIQDAVWNGTMTMTAKIDTAGLMTILGTVMTGNIRGAAATGNTPDAVMGKKTIDQGLLRSPQLAALLARLASPAATGHRSKRSSSTEQTTVNDSCTGRAELVWRLKLAKRPQNLQIPTCLQVSEPQEL